MGSGKRPGIVKMKNTSQNWMVSNYERKNLFRTGINYQSLDRS